MADRLHKFLANAGLGSRREIEGWIRAGRVSVNGTVATPGTCVAPGAVIRLDGRRLRLERRPPKRRVLMYHKPEGELVARSDARGRPTVFENFPRLQRGRWVAVGRLDINSSGLLLVTTDGELAQRLSHPRYRLEREYAVRVFGEVDAGALRRLQRGVELEDGRARFEKIVDAGGSGANHWYHVVLREGRNREVRRLWASQGVQVSRLMRVRFGPVALPRGLKPGRWRDLTAAELRALLEAVGLDGQEDRR